MKGSVKRGSAAPTDLLVCFPSRAHLSLMPKPICSPSRPTEPSKRHYPPRRSSSSIRSTTQHMSSSSSSSGVIDDEPTSPKVTCAGQIKVRPNPRSGKDWLLHQGKKGKKPNWLEILGFKKDSMQLLGGALRGLRFNVGGCLGSFAATVDYSTDEEEEEEEEKGSSSPDSSGAILSKWFMVLDQERQGQESKKHEEEVESSTAFVPPPPNALLLMRCRSAPAKGWLRGQGEDACGFVEGEDEMSAKKMREEEEEERLVLMSYAPDFFKVSDRYREGDMGCWSHGSIGQMQELEEMKRREEEGGCCGILLYH